MYAAEQSVIDAVIPSYEGLSHIGGTITALLNQQLPPGYILSVTVVDDGSSDNTSAFLKERFGQRIEIIRNEVNQGRSSACNIGAERGQGSYILFLDSDCIPVGASLLLEHLQTLDAGADISCGIVSSLKKNFWAEYQDQLALNRQKSAKTLEAVPAGTTANVLVKRSSYLKTGGFDIRYRHYGFEDRDFLLCMKNTGSVIQFTPTAIVSHEDELNLKEVCNKMQASGQYSSILFRENHPQEYTAMAYSRFDARVHPWLKYVFLVVRPILPLLRGMIEYTLEARRIPFGIRSMGVRLVSALYYMKGTTVR